jgi:uncharacterized membrane protein YccC
MATAAAPLPAGRRIAAVLQSAGAEPALFAVKSFAAAMLAYYLALRIGLTRPYWSVTTAYIVAAPLAGAVLSKAVFRVGGTILGAGAAVVLVPTFVNEPFVLSAALALWLGLCLYLSLLDRTPRAYVFLLAGYTASIVGFPSVAAPGAIFDVAIVRVQEIVLGILCASFVHGVVLPRTVTGQLLGRIDRMLGDAERWSADAITGQGGEALARDRRRLALDVNDLHQLSTHLPFDTARLRPRVRTIRALQDQVSLILPLASAVQDRLAVLEATDDALAGLLDDTAAWLKDDAGRADAAAALIDRARALEPVPTGTIDWQGALRLSLLARLADLIAAHRDARALREQILAPTALPVTPAVARLLADTRRRVLHLDRGTAVRAAFGTMATVMIGCTFWIVTGWADGAGAVLIAGVCCALFGSSDEPAPAVMRFFWGSLIGMAAAFVYAYAIFPRVTAFPVLVAVLAPAALLLGARMAQPPVSFVTLGATLGLFNGVGLADRYEPGFSGFVNGSIAQLVGTLFAAITVGLFQTIGTERSIERLIEAGWRDLARGSNGAGPPDARGWTSRMLDRIGLLAPRLAARGIDPGQPLLDVLVDLRIGLVAGELRTLRLDATDEERAAITPVLESLALHYRRRRLDRPEPPPGALLGCIDRALGSLAGDGAADRRRTALLALTSLRRNLYPAAPGWVAQVETVT